MGTPVSGPTSGDQGAARANACSDLVTWLTGWVSDGGSVLVLTDYDGTLTPIVDNPDEARLVDSVREDLRTLARSPRSQLAVISGRDVLDVRARVAVAEAVYAGCHGLDIRGPGLAFTHAEAATERGALHRIGDRLARRASAIPGMRVETKGLCLAIHYRGVAADRVPEVEVELARAVQRERVRAKIFHGIKVLEVLPLVRWGKAECALWVRDRLAPRLPPPVMTLYMGDEWTDEAVFEALAGQAITARVGADVPMSRATYQLPGVPEVHGLLSALARSMTGEGAA
jgi:trehalose 6-phosphate phosphatase